jgi:D-xylonolactonase
MQPGQITVAAAVDCELGENPVWDDQQECLYWTDITGGKMFELKPDLGAARQIYRGPPVGGFTLQRNGDFLLFRVNDIARLHPDRSVSLLQPFSDNGSERFNDVISDPNGRVFAGTIGKTEESGGLFRLDCDGTLHPLFRGTGCSNGMGFSPDLRTFYWTCSTSRRIFKFDYDIDSGNLANRKLFYECSQDEGIPDGMAVDEHGNIWSARWSGGSVVRLAPSGEPLGWIDFPVPNVTSLCFGGKESNQLFVTSATSGDAQRPEEGAVFQTRLPVRGGLVFKSQIELT